MTEHVADEMFRTIGFTVLSHTRERLVLPVHSPDIPLHANANKTTWQCGDTLIADQLDAFLYVHAEPIIEEDTIKFKCSVKYSGSIQPFIVWTNPTQTPAEPIDGADVSTPENLVFSQLTINVAERQELVPGYACTARYPKTLDFPPRVQFKASNRIAYRDTYTFPARNVSC